MTTPVRKLRILHVIGQMSRGGAERQLMELCAGLDRRYYEISICSLTPTWDMFDAYGLSDVRKVEAYKSSGVDVRIIKRLADVMREGSYDIVHTWMFTAKLWGRPAARLAGVPIVVTSVRSIIEEHDLLRIALDQIVVLLSDIVVVNSREVELVDRSHKLITRPYEVIWNGIDTERFVPVQAQTKTALRQALNILSGVPVVGTVGRLSAEKDYQTWIQTALHIKQDFPDVRFVIAGQGPQHDDILMWLDKANLGDITELIIDRADMQYIYPAMDVFLFTSTYEGMPNVILEAMACELPVVSTSVGGVPEVVVNGITGYLESRGDDQGLAKKVCYLLANPTFAQKMGQSARARAVEQFSVGKMVQSYHDLYQRLARQKHILGMR